MSKLASLSSAYFMDNNLAIKNRKKEYPALGDIIDALFKKEAGDSSEWDALATKRATTKDNRRGNEQASRSRGRNRARKA